ncbi:MAG: hypothetical protein GY795_04495 [Desulfobacterales bacterium]|nr:hypothetical protein [Desulfobacterales bacterium]
METQVSLRKLAGEVRQIYASDSMQAEALIEEKLEQRLEKLSPARKLQTLEKLAAKFSPVIHDASGIEEMEEEVYSKLFSLLLGKEVDQADLSQEELLKRLTETLNTIFTKLNDLVSNINQVFHGGDAMEKTIRSFIGYHLGGENHLATLEDYFDQINEAFLIARDSYKISAQGIVHDILEELDPDSIEETEGGFKITSFKKAEKFRQYEQKFKKCRKWFDSDKFESRLLREFENNCHKLAIKARR